jgi:hypothetical protein
VFSLLFFLSAFRRTVSAAAGSAASLWWFLESLCVSVLFFEGLGQVLLKEEAV